MRMKVLSLLLLLSLPAAAYAQPRPAAFTTVTTTDTGPDSLHVGCVIGSPACTGGVKAGASTFLSLRVTGADAVEITPGVPTVTGNKLYNNSGNLYWNGIALATGGSISGTTNYIPKFTGPSTLGSSIMSDNGSIVSVGGGVVATSNVISLGYVRADGGVYAGAAGAVNIVNASGRIPALTATYIADLNGSALTGVTASTLAAGAYAQAVSFVNPANVYYGSGTNLTGLNASELIYGSVPSGRLTGSYPGITSIGVSGEAALGYAKFAISDIFLTSGNNNNVNIGGAGVVFMHIPPVGGAVVTGFNGGVDGRVLFACSTFDSQPWAITSQSPNSISANRITQASNSAAGGSCIALVWYGGYWHSR